jgi:hypothetical protein
MFDIHLKLEKKSLKFFCLLKKKEIIIIIVKKRKITKNVFAKIYTGNLSKRCVSMF